MSQPLLIDQHTGSATYIETMRDDHFSVISWVRLRTTVQLYDGVQHRKPASLSQPH